MLNLKKERALQLRKGGATYSEILEEVLVAKSTLSLWLRSEKLSKTQKQRISQKKLLSMAKGWEARRKERKDRVERIIKESLGEIPGYLSQPLFTMGLALYWAEGSKEKSWGQGQLVSFSNMDVNTHKLMLLWIERYLNISRSELKFQLYVHETISSKSATERWSQLLKIEEQRISVYKKRNPLRTVRKNVEGNYIGVLRIVVPKSIDLNRRIAGWIDGVVKSLC